MKSTRFPYGFTMTEIMMTLAILAILTGLAIPNFRTTIEQGRLNEARANLNLIHMAQKIYRLNNGVFCCATSMTSMTTVNTNLSLELSSTYYTSVSVTRDSGTGAASYTARLTRNTTEGGGGSKYAEYQYTYAGDALSKTEGGNF